MAQGTTTWEMICPFLICLLLGPTVQAELQVSFGMRKLAHSTNQFGLDLYRARNFGDEINVAFCPYCIVSSLAAVLSGSRGHMELALRHALYLWGMHPQAINQAFKDMNAHLGINLKAGVWGTQQKHQPPNSSSSSALAETDQPENDLTLFSTMYVQRDFITHYQYQMQLQHFYNMTAHPLDFRFNPEETWEHINAVMEKRSGGKVRNILSDVPSPNTNILLLSGLHFDGMLDMNMLADGTLASAAYQNTRFGNPHMVIRAPNARIRYGRQEYLNCTAIEVPFRGGVISLVAILPGSPDGMNLVETRLSAQRLYDLMGRMEVRRVNLKMPRILVEHSFSNLTQALSHLGLNHLFSPGYAELFGISDFRWLHVSDITHKTMIEVREDSTSRNPSSLASSDRPIEVSLDRPFMYFIMDNISGLALAMGKIINP